jgi:hypothetical protein
MKKAILFLFALSCISGINIKGQTLFVPSGTSGVSFSDRNGSIGIGTASPRAYFDVYPMYTNSLKSVLARLSEGDQSGEGTFLGVRSYNSQAENNQPCCDIKSFALEHAFYSQINSSINFFRGGSITGGFITFNTNDNTERMRINMYGNVGIGTSTPSNHQGWNKVLDVNGVNHSKILATVNGDTYRTGIFSHNEEWHGGGGFIGTESNHNLFLITGYSPKMTILTNGNVLVGKTSQSNSTYKLDVVGKIRADEIVVNTTSADFVFEPTYKLRPLSELETFIRTNKHLPDIAPAKEMQENGVSAGEMQAKLLQKVEELTLYILQQEEKIKTMQQEINQLKNK